MIKFLWSFTWAENIYPPGAMIYPYITTTKRKMSGQIEHKKMEIKMNFICNMLF